MVSEIIWTIAFIALAAVIVFIFAVTVRRAVKSGCGCSKNSEGCTHCNCGCTQARISRKNKE